MDIHICGRQEAASMCSDEGRDDFQQLKPKGSHASFVTTVIAVTILLVLSTVFSRVTVNVLVFVLRVVFFCNSVHVRCSAPRLCVISKFCIRIRVRFFTKIRDRIKNPAIRIFR